MRCCDSSHLILVAININAKPHVIARIYKAVSSASINQQRSSICCRVQSLQFRQLGVGDGRGVIYRCAASHSTI